MSSEALYLLSTRIRQMDRGDTTQGLGNPGENVDSYFHPLPSSLFSVQTRQALEIEGKFASSTKKGQSHLANPGFNDLVARIDLAMDLPLIVVPDSAPFAREHCSDR